MFATRCAIFANSGNVPDADHFLKRQNYSSGTSCTNPPTGPLPIFGTNTTELTTNPCDFSGPFTVNIGTTKSVREHAYACMRAVMKGNVANAVTHFAALLALRDNTGLFPSTHSGSTLYDSRDLAFSLICANRLGPNATGVMGWTAAGQKTIETALASMVDTSTGGVWTNACTNPVTGGGSQGCYINPYVTSTMGIHGSSHLSTETTSLYLIAYTAP